IGFGIERVGDMAQFHGLVINGLGPLLIGIAKRAYADAGSKINVFLPFCIPEGRPLAVVNGNAVAPVGLKDILVIQALDLFKVHSMSSFLTRSWCRCPRGTALRSKWSEGSGRPGYGSWPRRCGPLPHSSRSWGSCPRQ